MTAVQTNLNVAANCGTCAHSTAAALFRRRFAARSRVYRTTPYQPRVSGAGRTELHVLTPDIMWYLVPGHCVPRNVTVAARFCASLRDNGTRAVWRKHGSLG